MLLAEELLLLAIDPFSGRPVNGSEPPLTPCLTGALVAELALAGAVLLDGKRFTPSRQFAPAGLLNEALVALASPKGRRSVDQLRRMDRELGRVWKRVVDGLVAQGVLGRDPRGPLQATAHPLLRADLRHEVLARVRAAAAGHGQIEPRTAVVLALSGPARLLEVVADAPHQHAKRRIAEATESTPVADVVKKVIAEAAAAASMIVITTSGAATTSSSF